MLEGTENQDQTQVDNGSNTPETSGEQDLFEALKGLTQEPDEDEDNNPLGLDDDDEEDDESDDDADSEGDEEDENLDQDDEGDEDEEETDTEKGEKREQSREENARFAAKRREQELERKVEERLAAMREQAPEFQLAQQLSEMYGTTPDVILQQMKEAQLQQEAERTGIPLEHLQEREEERQRLDSLETELQQLRFEKWESTIEADKSRLMDKYSVLTPEDMDSAVEYILNEVQNVDMPLEKAVYAVHGEKIIESLANAKVQDNLAKQGGRGKKTPPAPNNGKPSRTTKATQEERYIARQMGMSVEDYLKFK